MSAESAWYRAEETCAGYIQQIVGDEYGKEAFIGELPDSMKIDEVDRIWFFDLNGQGEAPLDADFNVDTAGGCGEWGMSGTINGLFKNRKDAQLFAGMIMQALNVEEGTLEGITRFMARGMPSLVRKVFPVANDQKTGGDIRLWILTYPVTVIFTSTQA